MNAPLKFYVPTQRDIDDVIHASFVPILRGAPARNKLKCFELIARDGRRRVTVYRQDVIDDLQRLAESADLIKQFGTDAVQSTLAAAFVEHDGGCR
jgi:hypothetical protein